MAISNKVLGLEMGSQQGTLVEGSEGFLKYLGTLQFQANVHLEAVPKSCFSPWSQLAMYEGNSVLHSARQAVFCDFDSPRNVLEVQCGCWSQLGAAV